MNTKLCCKVLAGVVGLCISSNRAIASETTNYTYDALGRLVASSISAGANSGVTTSFAYDSAGNRKQVTTAGASPVNCTIQVLDRTYTIQPGYYGNSTFYIFNASGDCAGVVVNYSTQNGTASSGVEYDAASGTITLNSNPTYQGITISNLYIADYNSDGKYFYINISSGTSGVNITDSQSKITLWAD